MESHVFQKLWEAILTLAAVVIITWLTKITPAIQELFRGKKTHKTMPFEREIERDQRAVALLNQALGELHADRVFYSKIHNGDSLETRRKTRVYEVVGPGMMNACELYQSIPIGLVLEEMALIEKEGPSWAAVVDLTECKFKRLLQISGVKSVIRCAVYRNKRIGGFIGVDFVRHLDRPNDELLKRAWEYATMLEQIMEMYEQ